MHSSSTNFMTATKSITMMVLLVAARSVTSFLPASSLQRTSPASAVGVISRRFTLNSHWIKQKRASAVRPAAAVADSSSNEEKEDDESSSSSSTATEKSSSDKNNPWAAFENRNNIRDQVVSAISKDGGIKVTACTIRNSVNDLMMQHTMTDVAIQAMGRTLTCALLMSNGMQLEQTVQITLATDGPLRGLVAIASGKGDIRGFVGTPMLGQMTLEEAVGKGALQVVKNHPEWPRPYNGITEIRHGDIDRDVGIYLAESEQRSCALAAATSVTGILCTASGGYLIEQLPDCSDEEVEKVEKNLATLVEKDGGDQLPTNLLLKGTSPLELMEIILDGLDMQPLQEMTPILGCECTEDRLLRALRLLPSTEVDSLLEKEEKLEARCEFCGKVYSMGSDEVRTRLDEAKGDPSVDGQ